MLYDDTIAGVATAVGEGGIAIVRVSGPNAKDIFERAFASRGHRPPYASHVFMAGWLMDGERRVDEAMGVIMLAPKSYTREDVCEIHVHGGLLAAGAAMDIVTGLGARVAQPGEFTRRAFMNGRIDLMQAEAVMGVISASSRAALLAESRILSGGQSGHVLYLRQRLTSLLSGIEAFIDYPDEVSYDEAVRGLNDGLSEIEKELSGMIDERAARILAGGVTAVICGSPNAGKSTLFNALLREERAIVTDAPGTTRDVLRGSLILGGMRVNLLDTAGLRAARDKAETIGVERARRAALSADAALLVLDSGHAPTDEDRAFLASPPDCPCAVLLNKHDEPSAISPPDIERITDIRPVLSISAKTGQGLDCVREYLSGIAKEPHDGLLTHQRHIEAAKDALYNVREAIAALRGGVPIDMVEAQLRQALYLLGRITGESVDEQLLDEIFSRFCVGK